MDKSGFIAEANVLLTTDEFDSEQACLRLDVILEEANRRLEEEGKGRSICWLTLGAMYSREDGGVRK